MSSLDELTPSLGTATAVHVDRSMFLELFEGSVSGNAKNTVHRVDGVAQRNQSGLQISNMVPLSPDAKRTNERGVYRNSPISSSSAPLGFAPMSFLAGSPFSKTMRAGMLMIS